jgi:hypothetical protein
LEVQPGDLRLGRERILRRRGDDALQRSEVIGPAAVDQISNRLAGAGWRKSSLGNWQPLDATRAAA